jgi:hypothetical protein
MPLTCFILCMRSAPRRTPHPCGTLTTSVHPAVSLPKVVLNLVGNAKITGLKIYPQGEQFYTDALSVLALSAVFAPQHGERK